MREVCGREPRPGRSLWFRRRRRLAGHGCRPAPGVVNFTVLKGGPPVGEFFLPHGGGAQCLERPGGAGGPGRIGAEAPPLQNALTGQKGVKKRQEVAGEFDGVLVVEDFTTTPPRWR